MHGGEGSGLDEDNAMTPEGLSWRRLHMSRAKLKATATTSELLSGFAMVSSSYYHHSQKPLRHISLSCNSHQFIPLLLISFLICSSHLYLAFK